MVDIHNGLGVGIRVSTVGQHDEQRFPSPARARARGGLGGAAVVLGRRNEVDDDGGGRVTSAVPALARSGAALLAVTALLALTALLGVTSLFLDRKASCRERV